MAEETLYKTDKPQLGISEYYELSVNGKVLDTEQEGISEAEAWKMFNKAKDYLVSAGFVHSFMWSFEHKRDEYQLLTS